MIKTVLLSIAVTSITLTGQAQSTSAADCITSNPIGFIRCVARTPDVAVKLKNLDSSDPFFVVFESNEEEWLMSHDESPTLQYAGSEKTYQFKHQKNNSVENFALSLTSVNPNFFSTFEDNMLCIRQKETEGAGWPMNSLVQECQETTLTVRDGTKLLKDKYHLETLPIMPEQEFDKILTTKTDDPVPVRQLVGGVLRSYVAACYRKGDYQNSIAAFQVKSLKQAGGVNTIEITYITVPKTD